MKLMTVAEIAKEHGLEVDEMREHYAAGKIGGQTASRILFSTEAQVDAWLKGEAPAEPVEAPEFLLIKEAADLLGVSVRQVRKLIDVIPTYTVTSPGRTGTAYLFAKEDLLNADIKPPGKPGPGPKGNPDPHLARKNGRYVVKGTLNAWGRPYSYKKLSVARRMARKAYKKEAKVKAGTAVLVDLGRVEKEGVLVQDMTFIDKKALIQVEHLQWIEFVRNLKFMESE